MPEPFKNWQEIKAAMADPKYATDDAYRQQVIDRLAVTDLEPAAAPTSDTPPIPVSPSWLQGFRSDVELSEAMSHPRYARDAAYRADVAAAIAVSDPRLIGISTVMPGSFQREEIDPDAAKALQDDLTIKRRTTGYPDVPLNSEQQ